MAAGVLLCLAFLGVMAAGSPPLDLPFTVAADEAGRQLVRVSLPFPPGLLRESQTAIVRTD